MADLSQDIAPLRHWSIKPDEKSFKLTKAITEHFLEDNILLHSCLDRNLPSIKYILGMGGL